MTIEELLAVCAEHDVLAADLPHVFLQYRDGEGPLETIGRATRRCHLCQTLLGDDYVETADNGLFWCPDLIMCKDRARERLHVPRRERRRILRDELHAAGRRPGVIRLGEAA